MEKTVVINVVGLSERLMGKYTPFLEKWKAGKNVNNVKPVLPAVTCSAQATYLTGKKPAEHGIVGNGWYFKDLCEVKFWHQSNKLVQSEKIWEAAKKKNPAFTCANMFWWYNMYSSADYSATPRPMYPADGRKIPDCYTYPLEMREELQKKLGQFPLFNFWGPKTSVKSSQWIAEASKYVDERYNPTLSLIYLPHLDYNLQRWGNDFNKIRKDLKEIDKVCENLIRYYEKRKARVIVLSEYGITDVSNPVHINQVFRANGLISVREELGLELLDAGASAAFAVADHQIAHIYVNEKEKLEKVRTILEGVEGIEIVLDKAKQKEFGLNHDRSGDFVVVADKDSWFTYYYWLDDKKAPDFARTVEIHRKPGYDPVELFTDPQIKFLAGKVGVKLLKKKLGFRTLLDIIPLTPSLVKGSHGRVPENKIDWPVFISSCEKTDEFSSEDVYRGIWDTMEL